MKRARPFWKPGRIASTAGFSLVEMSIALVIVLIAAAGIYSVFISQRNQTASQRIYNELQNDVTFAMDYMKNELILAGYRAINSDRPISAACQDTITFEYWDDNLAASGSLDQHVQVTYRVSGGKIWRDRQRYDTTSSSYLSLQPQDQMILLENATALAFTYRGGDNTNLAFTGTCLAAPDPIEDVRIVEVAVSGRSRRADPLLKDPATGAPYYRTMSLRGEVKSRNLRIAATPLDTTAPAVPTGLEARDAAECDEQLGYGTARVAVRWNQNTDPDLAGYTLYYGTAAGAYSGRIRLGREKGTAGQKETYLLGNLVHGQTYFIAISAFDRSGNQSALAAPVSGNPDPSETDFASGSNDTTPNPTPPTPPADFQAALPAGEDFKVDLSWTPSVSPGVVGYRIYRGATPDFTPLGEAAGSGNCIADETTVDSTFTTYQDSGLEGCQIYYYKIASLACDSTLFATYTDTEFALSYGDGPGPGADVPVATVSNSTPTDSQSPPSPTISARPGYKRIILTLTNPTVADFSYTEVWFSKVGYPTIDPVTGVIGGTGVQKLPNRNGAEPGRYYNVGGQSVWSVNFKHETSDDPLVPPALDIGTIDSPTTYYFLAVAYDECGNHSELTAFSIVEALQCGDCDVGETCHGAPPMDTVNTEGCAVSGAPYVVFDTVGPGITLSWPFASETVYRDLAGYRVYRQVYSPGLNSLGPGQAGSSWSESDNLVGAYSDALWLDRFPDTTVAERTAYSYLVCASDCYWERYKEEASPPADAADNLACRLVSTSPIYVGGLDQKDRPFVQQTALDGPMLAGDTTATVLSTADFPEAGSIEVTSVSGREVMDYNGVTATTFQNVVRDVLGTGQFTHGDGAQVTVFPFPPPVESRSSYGLIDPLMSPFDHNVVTYWVDNTAAGVVTLTGFRMDWTNTDAYLRWIDIGDNDTTSRTGPPNYDFFSDLPFIYGWFTDPVSGSPLFNGSLTLSTPKDIVGLDDVVPFRLAMLTQDGTGRPDMRESFMTTEVTYENPSMNPPTSCRSTRKTITIPLGPVIRSVTQDNPEPVTISWPVPGDSGTNVMDAVIGNGGPETNVTAVVQDSSNVGMLAVLLFYYIDSGAVLSSPPDFSPVDFESIAEFDASLLPPGWSMTPMCNVAGPEYRTISGCTDPLFGASSPIPASDGNNVWYFVMAEDLTGNFDRAPEAGSGAFQYFQKEATVCDTLPPQPTITGSADGAANTVTLTVTIPTTNAWPFGGAFDDMAGYQVYRNWGRGFVPYETVTATTPGMLSYVDTIPIPNTSLAAAVTGTATTLPVGDTTGFVTPATVVIGSEAMFCSSRTDTSFEGCQRGHFGTTPAAHSSGATVQQNLLVTENLTYMIRSFDTCAPDANMSAASNLFTECIGAPDCILRLTPENGNFLYPGDTFNVDLTICSKQGGVFGPTPGETVYVQVCSDGTGDTDPVELLETGDSGQFSINSAAYMHDNKPWVTTYAAADYDALPSTTRTDLKVLDVDRVKVTAYREPIPAPPPCDPFFDPGCTPSTGTHDPAPYSDNFGGCEIPDPLACDESALLVIQDPCTALLDPGTPTGLTAIGPCTDNPPKQVNLAWTDPGTGLVSHYEIQVCQQDNAGNCTWSTLPETPTATSFTTVAPASISNKIIKYRVVAVNALCPTNHVTSESLPVQAVCATP